MTKYLIFSPFFISTDQNQTNGFLGGSGIQAYKLAKEQQHQGKKVIILTLKIKGASEYERFENIDVFRVGTVSNGEISLSKKEVEKLINEISPNELMIFFVQSGKSKELLYIIEKMPIQNLYIRYGATLDIDSLSVELETLINRSKNILVNQSMIKIFQNKFPGAPIDIKPNIAGTGFFQYDKHKKLQLREKYHIPSNIKCFLYTGRLVKSKGVDLLIDIFNRIPSRINCLVIFVGDDHSDRMKGQIGYVEELKVLTKNYPQRFKYLGAFKYSKMPEIYNLADYFCLPTLKEGMSNSLLEALACGLKCFASDIAENRLQGVEIVQDFEKIVRSTLHVPYGDPNCQNIESDSSQHLKFN